VFFQPLASSLQPPRKYTARTLPAFFDSVLQLIIRTSTDLPPDVRAAMKAARGAEPAGTRAAQALTIIAQNIDLALVSFVTFVVKIFERWPHVPVLHCGHVEIRRLDI
jgi:hypothetical protein